MDNSAESEGQFWCRIRGDVCVESRAQRSVIDLIRSRGVPPQAGIKAAPLALTHISPTTADDWRGLFRALVSQLVLPIAGAWKDLSFHFGPCWNANGRRWPKGQVLPAASRPNEDGRVSNLDAHSAASSNAVKQQKNSQVRLPVGHLSDT
jgi:hypothetical protein